ncbi:VirB8/TrbF family protein [Acidiphilium acidophilum]|uniref:VirB8/TrbF family protein n=1 Tax=Acidiphilium acidophilum TaxID=76588 RepID=UPI002E8E7736|nr:VirB8/TrbF family protein [Acidiphilium acidophilum]
MSDSPDYTAAKREWMERYGSYISQARNWRLAAFCAISVAALGVAGTAYEGSQTHVVPYVVEVDHLGQSVRLAQAVRAGAVQQPIVRHVLARWLTEVRERTTDSLAQRQFVDSSYRYVDSKMEVALDRYFKRHSPFIGSADGPRTVTITSAIPLHPPTATGGSYQIDFVEKQHGLTGRLISVQTWKAIISYSILPVDNAKQALSNPFGIYITSFQWEKSL